MKRLQLIVALMLVILSSSCTVMDSYRLSKDPEQKALAEAFVEAKGYQFGAENAPLIFITRAAQQSQDDPARRMWLEQQFLEMLQDPLVTDDAKDFACRQLYYVGTDNCVYVLKDLLLDEQFSNIARYALERNPHPSVDKLLQESLPKTEGEIKVGILNSMAVRGKQDSTMAVISALDDSNPEVVRAAMHALGEIGTPAAGMVLGYMKEVGVGLEFEDAFSDAYLRCAENLHEAGDDFQARSMFLELYSHEMPTQVRISALRGLVMTSDLMALDHLPTVLESRNPAMTGAAAQLIREMPETPPTDKIAAKLPDLKPETQVLLLEALIDRGDKAAFPQALELTQTEDEMVRVVALRSLATFGDADTIPTLAKSAANAEGAEKQAAQYGLNRLTGVGVNEKMVALLDEAPTAEKIELVKSLANRRAFDSVPALLKTAADADTQVQAESYRSLAILAGADDVNDILRLLLKVQDAGVRKEAEKTTITICQKSPDSVQKVVGVFDKTTDTINKCSLLRVVGKFGGEPAFGRAQGVLNSGDEELSDTAIRVLSEWPDSLAIDDLKKVAKNSDQEIHRVLAFRGFVRLVGADKQMSAEDKFAQLKDAFAMAQRPDQKKLVLSTLGVVHSVEALEMAEKYIDNDELKSEASMTVLKIARGLPSDSKEPARKAVEKIMAGSPEESVAKEANKLLDEFEKEMDHIVRWEVSGPFMKQGLEGGSLLTKAEFPPEDFDSRDVEWKSVQTEPNKTWYLDLAKHLGAGDNRVGYLRTKIWSPEEKQAKISIGSDDGIRVWLNREVVMTVDAGRGCAPNQNVADIVLKEGWNDLLMKVNNVSSHWGACARLRTPDGRHIEGLKYLVEGE